MSGIWFPVYSSLTQARDAVSKLLATKDQRERQLTLTHCRALIEESRLAVALHDLRQTLTIMPVLRGVPDAFIASVLRTAELRTIGQESHIITVGGMDHTLYLLLSGSVDVILPNGAKVSSLGKGEFFGEKGWCSKQPRTATLIARSACEVRNSNDVPEGTLIVLPRSVKCTATR